MWYSVFAKQEDALIGIMLVGMIDVILLFVGIGWLLLTNNANIIHWWMLAIPVLTIGRMIILLKLNA